MTDIATNGSRSGTGISVLFVDDESNVLRGLRRMLADKRDVWSMRFVDSGMAALEALEAAPADVVVTDMRMPGMDGAKLLAQVRDRHPGTVRIVLSGYAEQEAVLRTIGPSHQYLAKPCTADQLTKAIARSLQLREIVADDGVRAMVSGLTKVPALPGVFRELMALLQSDDASPGKVADIIAADVGLVSQLLRVTNSAYFSLPSRATTPRQAILFLGLDTVKALIMMAGIFQQFEGDPEAAQVLRTLGDRSLMIGQLARAIADAEGYDNATADAALTSGLLAHVGTLTLAGNHPRRFRQVGGLIDKDRLSVIEAERRVFGADHAAIGAYLLGLWGFRHAIVEAVAFHHTPSAAHVLEPGATTAVHIAQHLVRVNQRDDLSDERSEQSLDNAYLDDLRLRGRMKAWQMVYTAAAKEWP